MAVKKILALTLSKMEAKPWQWIVDLEHFCHHFGQPSWYHIIQPLSPQMMMSGELFVGVGGIE